MNRVLALALLATLTLAIPAFAQDEQGPPAGPAAGKTFTVDASAGLSFGLFDGLSPDFKALETLASIASIRGGFDADLLFHVNDFVAVGPQLGVYALQYSYDGKDYTFLDIPVRAAVKLGKGSLFVQPYCGYYLAPAGFPFSGLEAGVRGCLGGLFLEASYVMGEPQWKHIAVGFTAADVWGF